jgi:hypothetical protein
MKKIIGLIFVAGGLIVSCGEDDPLDAAWALFRDGNYAGAHAAFTELIPSEGGQAYMGLGWTALKMDSIPEANAYLNTAIATKDSILDAVAGNVFAFRVLDMHNACIFSANAVLQKKPTYVFTHERTITHHDLNVHKAYSLFDLNRLADCFQTILILDPGFTLATTDSTAELLAKLDSLYDEFN